MICKKKKIENRSKKKHEKQVGREKIKYGKAIIKKYQNRNFMFNLEVCFELSKRKRKSSLVQSCSPRQCQTVTKNCLNKNNNREEPNFELLKLCHNTI